METEPASYAVIRQTTLSFDATVETLRNALADQGFGILCEIDVSATLKKKLDADYPKTLILGACNPPLALRALTAVPDISVFLPCNVVVRMHGAAVEVAVINPLIMAEMIHHPEIGAVAQDADARLRNVLNSLAA
ncbi:MAG: DUF302 domain-containing protein [Magnetococcales bacterium]|nr:DUF302 domain-containing protein [Magnetococcales bacterium]